MSSRFDKAMQDIAIKSAKNGGATNTDILTALKATNEDLDCQHQESLEAITANRELLEVHLGEALIRDERIAKLEAYREDAQRTCADKVKALIDSEHTERHALHMADMHALDEEGYDMRKAWRTVKWALIVIAGGVLVALADQIGHLIFGGAT